MRCIRRFCGDGGVFLCVCRKDKSLWDFCRNYGSGDFLGFCRGLFSGVLVSVLCFSGV